MKRLIFRKSIKNRITLYFSILFLSSIVIFGVISYNIFSNILTSELSSYTSKIVDEARINLDSYFSQIETLMQITASNSILLDAVKNYSNSNYSVKLYSDRVIQDFLQDTMKINPKIKDIIIVDNRGFAYEYTGRALKQDYNFFKQTWFPHYSDKVFKAVYVGLHSQDYYLIPTDENEGSVISAIIPIADFMNPKKPFYATVIFNLNVSKVEEINKEITLEKTGFFLILDNHGQAIYRPHNYQFFENSRKYILRNMTKDTGSFELKVNNQDMIIVYKTSKVTSWKLIAVIPRGEIYEHLSSIKNFTFTLTLICILVVLLVSLIISNTITNPITRLMKRMSKIEQGDFSVKLYDNSSEEIEMLSSRMDLMIEGINSLNRDLYSYQIKNRDAAIRALQAQINPHFLNNTLQAIKAMAVCGKSAEISRITTLLGNMFRYSIYNTKDLVAIRDEIKHVQEYLEIQNFRYPGQFDYNIECEADIEELKTIKLILQPIVENCIQHGLSQCKNGFINIVIEKNISGIQITISDNGKGIIDQELSKIINHMNDQEQKDDSHSIGLKNVHERIKLKFGDPNGITIISKENEGTCIKIQIPEIS